MKVIEFRRNVNEIFGHSEDAEALNRALQRFDDMLLSQFTEFLKGVNSPELSALHMAQTLRPLVSEPQKFEAKLDSLAESRNCTKAVLQSLFQTLFDTDVKLPPKLKKEEMVERIKRKRRRIANFEAA